MEKQRVVLPEWAFPQMAMSIVGTPVGVHLAVAKQLFGRDPTRVFVNGWPTESTAQWNDLHPEVAQAFANQNVFAPKFAIDISIGSNPFGTV